MFNTSSQLKETDRLLCIRQTYVYDEHNFFLLNELMN